VKCLILFPTLTFVIRGTCSCCHLWTPEQYLQSQGKKTICFYIVSKFSYFYLFQQHIIIPQDTLNVADDLLITAELCFLLQKNRSGVRATDSLVTRLLIGALNRGILTSFVAALSLALVSPLFEIRNTKVLNLHLN